MLYDRSRHGRHHRHARFHCHYQHDSVLHENKLLLKIGNTRAASCSAIADRPSRISCINVYSVHNVYGGLYHIQLTNYNINNIDIKQMNTEIWALAVDSV